ncbi:hypothetical protein HNO88_002947 [Novosphingobium chloroacetimidivorans]|uniref:Uncharacterized protein n=1 Tax=Novosphingobium chloroacetimidivorans TaxID=1428314 RepID=A0A7W7KCD4_9SPHN|nr:hypothetical protein [Novosphingobium chloroacetimidivorans]MBB4859618.1 hypothetical protein [Novosphingobium chloroacetimidivorans]
MAANSPNFAPTDTWQDLYAQAGYTGLANQKVTVQTVARGAVKLYAGGTTPPADTEQGFTLAAGQSWTGTTDHLWLRGTSRVAVGVED